MRLLSLKARSIQEGYRPAAVGEADDFGSSDADASRQLPLRPVEVAPGKRHGLRRYPNCERSCTPFKARAAAAWALCSSAAVSRYASSQASSSCDLSSGPAFHNDTDLPTRFVSIYCGVGDPAEAKDMPSSNRVRAS